MSNNKNDIQMNVDDDDDDDDDDDEFVEDPFILDKEKIFKLEQLNEEVASLKYQRRSFESRRNLNREAFKKLNDLEKSIQNAEKQPIWMNFSDIFIRFPINEAKEIIRNDQSKLESEYSEIDEQLNSKVNQLQKLQQLKPDTFKGKT
jgi:hypothetical protein